MFWLKCCLAFLRCILYHGFLLVWEYFTFFRYLILIKTIYKSTLINILQENKVINKISEHTRL